MEADMSISSTGFLVDVVSPDGQNVQRTELTPEQKDLFRKLKLE